MRCLTRPLSGLACCITISFSCWETKPWEGEGMDGTLAPGQPTTPPHDAAFLDYLFEVYNIPTFAPNVFSSHISNLCNTQPPSLALPFTDKPPYSRTIYKFTRPRNYPSPQHNLPLHPSLNSVITSLTTKNNPLLIWRLFILPAALLLQKPAVPAMQCNHQQGSIHPSIHSLP